MKELCRGLRQPSKKSPWKGGKDRMAVAKAFMIIPLPFVVVEAATGVASLMTSQLSIPPTFGAGTAFDSAVFVSGLVVIVLWARKDDEERHRED